MNFEEFFMLKEDPDLVFVSVDNKQHELYFDDPSAHTFGFVNGFLKYENFSFELPDIDGKIFVQPGTTHPVLMRDVLVATKNGSIAVDNRKYDLNSTEVCKVIENLPSVLGRVFFKPAGRMWVQSGGAPCNLMSWWQFSSEISQKHINEVLDHLNIPHNEREHVYIECEDFADRPPMQLKDFTHYNSPNITDEMLIKHKDKLKKVHVAAAERDPKKLAALQAARKREIFNALGSVKQRNIASKAGYPTFAEYDASTRVSESTSR